MNTRQLSDFFPARPQHVNYLVNWARKRGVVYVETPKVGCTTIKRILQYSELDYDESALPEDVHERSTSPLQKPKDHLQSFLDCMQSDDCFKFSFVRSPITRLLSAYLDKVIGRPDVVTPAQKELGINPHEYIPTFAEFVAMIRNQSFEDMNVHWAPQSFLLGLPTTRYDYMGRFEHFGEALQELMRRTSLRAPPGAINFGRQHATDAESRVDEYYDAHTLKQVQEIYADDFRYLGYGWTY